MMLVSNASISRSPFIELLLISIDLLLLILTPVLLIVHVGWTMGLLPGITKTIWT